MNILVGFLPTAEGIAALKRGIDEAKLRGAFLIVVHIRQSGVSSADLIAVDDELGGVDRVLENIGVPHEILDVDESRDPSTEILRIAEEHEVDLIVIGIRKRSQVGKLILGSNAADILLNSACAVLSVKASSGR